jgi:hypothetical protein
MVDHRFRQPFIFGGARVIPGSGLSAKALTVGSVGTDQD